MPAISPSSHGDAFSEGLRWATRNFLASSWAIGLAAAALWIARYAWAFGLRFAKEPEWTRWFDQGNYLRSAHALAQGDFAPANHWYPIAYPLLAAPFASLRVEPFFVPNAALFGITAVAFTRAVAPLVTRWVAMGIFAASILLLDNTALFWLEPWTTTLSAALIWCLIAAIVAIAFSPGDTVPDRKILLFAGAVAGALPMVRPPDGVVSFCAILYLLGALHRRSALTGQALLWTTCGALLALAPLALVHLAIHGTDLGGYIAAGRNQGFAFSDLPWRTYVLLITPAPWFPDAKSLTEGLPLLIPGGAGLIVIATTRGPVPRRWAALAMACAVPYALVYLAYTDLLPPGLWRFNNAHYFKWLFPLFGLGLWFWLGSFGRLRDAVVATCALLLMMMPAFFRLLPVEVTEAQPARMLLFHGGDHRIWSDAYFAAAEISDDKGRLTNVGAFHQVPARDGERAIAVMRLFGSHPRRRDPGDLPAYRDWQAPYARYGTRVSFGWPCWFAPGQCVVPPAH